MGTNIKRFKKVLIIFTLFLGLTLLISGCGQQGQEKATSSKEVINKENKVKGITVNVLEVQKKNFKVKLPITGNIVAKEEVKIFSEISGKLEELKVKEGEQVTKGATIVLLDDDILEVKLTQAQANLEGARANLAKVRAGARSQEIKQAQASFEQAQVNFENAKREYERMKDLYKDKAITEQKLDNIEAKYKSAKAGLEVVRQKLDLIKAGARKEDEEVAISKVKQAKAALDLSREHLKNTVVKAPISGVITDIFLSTGEMISPQTPLGNLIQMEEVLLEAYISTKELREIKEGQSVKARVDSYPEEEFKGQISRIGDKINKKSRSVKLEIRINNSNLKLKPGMFAQGEIMLDNFKEKIILPSQVLREDKAEKIVYLLKAGKVVKREIEGRLITKDKFLLRSGLEVGEKVISSNLNQIVEGEAVYVEKEESDE
jgi:multidrug resistance efflux pump